jgi:hypothetical protein
LGSRAFFDLQVAQSRHDFLQNWIRAQAAQRAAKRTAKKKSLAKDCSVNPTQAASEYPLRLTSLPSETPLYDSSEFGGLRPTKDFLPWTFTSEPCIEL